MQAQKNNHFGAFLLTSTSKSKLGGGGDCDERHVHEITQQTSVA